MRHIFSLSTLFVAASLMVGGLVVGTTLTGCTSETAKGAMWCKEHGVEEKYCVLCHPEIREEGELLLCPAHGNIPEAICTKCHPELKEKYETCPHDLPSSFCPKCSPEFAATLGDQPSGDQHGEHAHEHKHKHGHDHDHTSEGDPS